MGGWVDGLVGGRAERVRPPRGGLGGWGGWVEEVLYVMGGGKGRGRWVGWVGGWVYLPLGEKSGEDSTWNWRKA